jgi:hypothetical protein
MTISTPACLGAIFRKDGRTLAFVQRDKERLLALRQRRDPSATLVDVEKWFMQVEDEHLVGLSLAMNARDLDWALQEIEADGFTRGVDFVVTESPAGALDKPLPSWLSVEMKPVTFSEEQLAKMEPHFRKLAERQAPTMTAFYSFVPESEAVSPST